MIASGNHLLTQVKDNQPGLRRRLELGSAGRKPSGYARSQTKGRNRWETRELTVFPAKVPIPTKAPVYNGIIPPGDSGIMAPPFYEMIPPGAPRSSAVAICLTCSGFWSSGFGSFAADAS